jgi:predicted nucleotide-binding protein
MGWQYADYFPKDNRETVFRLLLKALAVRAKDIGIILDASGAPSLEELTSSVREEIPRVFISYSHKDIEFVKNLATDLQTIRLDVWWDISGIRGGNSWIRSIQDALDKSKYCIVVITPDSMISPWVEKEYTYAMNNNKIVIPLFLRDCKLPFSFSNTQYVDFRENRYRTAMYELYSALDIKVG